MRGNTLLVPSGPQVGHKHLFALMIDPIVIDGYGQKPYVLIACVTSVKDGMPGEDVCLISQGEHPFIEHDSYIDYRFTRLEQADHLHMRLQEGVFIEKDPCSSELIKRIIQGALKSRRINREYKRLLEVVLFE